MNSTEEKELVTGCLQNDRKYQELLYLKFCRKMMGICSRYTNTKEEAEDILQEAFLKVFTRLYQFKSEGSLEGWIRKIVQSTIYDAFRKKSVMVVLLDDDAIRESEVSNDYTSYFDREELLIAIRDLSPGYRTVFNMFEIDGYSHKEIANLLGISEGTSKSQLYSAKMAIKKKLKDFNRISLTK